MVENMGSRLGIATRLWLLVALLLTAMAVTGGYGAWALQAAQERNAQSLAHMRQLADALDSVQQAQDDVSARVRQLQRKARADEAQLLAAGAQATRQAAWVQGTVFVLALLLSVLFGALLVASVRRPLREVIMAAMRVADGDLSTDVRVQGRDEAARLLGATAAMTQQLRGLVQEVKQRARSVADSTAQVVQGHVDLSQRTEEQASTLEETASSMEELTATVVQNTDSARQASRIADEAAGLAGHGGEVVAHVVSTMGRISESSSRIAEITGVIDGIAFQTNILALNAAVEAARAGEQGRGFAVVAAEVRILAERSAEAAREIKALIVGSVEEVRGGAALVDTAGLTMQQIVDAVQKVSALVREVAAASEEQSTGIGMVNTAVTQMDHVVQQNAALVEEATAALHSMSAQAHALLEAVRRFRVSEDEGPADGQVFPATPWRALPVAQRVR
jgi:methyl-accepting chemotaxis protein